MKGTTWQMEDGLISRLTFTEQDLEAQYQQVRDLLAKMLFGYNELADLPGKPGAGAVYLDGPKVLYAVERDR